MSIVRNSLIATLAAATAASAASALTFTSRRSELLVSALTRVDSFTHFTRGDGDLLLTQTDLGQTALGGSGATTNTAFSHMTASASGSASETWDVGPGRIALSAIADGAIDLQSTGDTAGEDRMVGQGIYQLDLRFTVDSAASFSLDAAWSGDGFFTGRATLWQVGSAGLLTVHTLSDGSQANFFANGEADSVSLANELLVAGDYRLLLQSVANHSFLDPGVLSHQESIDSTFAFSVVAIPLPSGAGLALAGLTLVGTRRRRTP